LCVCVCVCGGGGASKGVVEVGRGRMGVGGANEGEGGSQQVRERGGEGLEGVQSLCRHDMQRWLLVIYIWTWSHASRVCAPQ